MYISNLFIKNYRSIEKENIQFNMGKNILVGKNNAGKSNIVKALDLILGEKSPLYREIEEKDFFLSSDNKKKEIFFISVKLKGNDINEEEISKSKGTYLYKMGKQDLIEKFIANSKANIESLLKNVDNITEKKWKKGSELVEILKKSEYIYIYFCVAKSSIGKEEEIDFDENKENYSKTYSMLIKYDDEFYRCSKFPNTLRDSLLTSAILPAFREPSNQFRINTYSWYGKLIKNIWDDKNYEEIRNEINEKLSEVKGKTDMIFKNAIEEIKEKIEKSIYHNSISFQLLQNTKDDVYKGVNIFLDDGIETPIIDKGSGIQSAVIISLFSYYCNTFHKNSSLLVVEEPEIYLHPQARRVLSTKFDEFISYSENLKNQVIITTHSVEFIRNVEIENIIIVKKENGKTNVKRITSNDDIKEIQKIKKILWNKNAEMFFADKVILVEGAEEYLLQSIADKIAKENKILDYKNISVVNVGGKSFFPSYVELLKSLEIKYYVLADFDIITNGIESLKKYISNYDTDKINILKAKLNELADLKNSKTIKEKINPNVSLDGKKIYEIIDKICENKQYCDDLNEIWEYFKTKLKNKVNHIILSEHKEIEKQVFEIIEELKESNIYILKKGELEDYITKLGMDIAREEGITNQKELRILMLVDKIENKEIEIENIFEIEEFEELIKKALEL